MFHKTTGRYWGLTELLGYDISAALWHWKDGADFYISAIPGKPLGISSGTPATVSGRYYPTGFLYNGKDVYTGLPGGVLWYDGSRYVISAHLGYGTEEYYEDTGGEAVTPATDPATYVPVTRTWYGDAWWSCATLAGSYAARGSGYASPLVIKDASGNNTTTPPTLGAAKVVAFNTVIGWNATAQHGKYLPVAGTGTTGEKYAGWLKYRDAAHANSPYKSVKTSVATLNEDGTTTTVENIVLSYITTNTPNSTVVTVEGKVTTTVTTTTVGGSNVTTSVVTFIDTGALSVSGKTIFSGNSLYLWHGENIAVPTEKDRAGADVVTAPMSGWFISQSVESVNMLAGFWSQNSATLTTGGTFVRRWLATPPPAPPETTPPTYRPPDPLDIDKNNYSLTLLEYGSEIRQTPQLMAQVAMWL